jgi:restriction system protein
MTILEAIKTVMRAKGAPMTAPEAYAAIASARLYEFHTDSPASIVRAQMRRHSEGLALNSSPKVKHFKALPDGQFDLLPGT